MLLLRQDIADAMIHARASGMQPPASVLEEFRHISASSGNGEPRIFKRAGDIAEIRIEGVLSPKMDLWALWYGEGCTTYGDIIQSLALASADPSIRRVVLNIASPGGYVAGLFDCLAALELFSKPKEVTATMADSAAYAIAALGGKITAVNPAAEFGSVGVVQTHVKYDFAEIINITSTHAPDKRPDPGTEEGRATIRKHLDDLHDLFVDAIARGRGKTKDVVNQTFGRGAVVLAKEAKSLGMVDKILKVPGSAVPEPGPDDAGAVATAQGTPATAATTQDADPSPPAPAATATTPAVEPQPSASPAPAAPAPQQPAPANSGGAPRRNKMDAKQLQSEHPDTYAAVLKLGREEGHAAGVKAGTEAEQKRTDDHLTAGEACGDFKLAHKAIKEGKSFTDMQAQYFAANMKRSAMDASQQDSDEAGKAVDGKPPAAPTGATTEDAVAAELNKLMGPPPAKGSK
ncbi:MAG TPA: S49 family peptidase [Polyangiaceae bacterium]|nr:S49 family peptidase [Polyangiaceae bacterium]